MLSPVEVLKFALTPIIHEYDVVLVDCPPSLNLMTRNALEISDYYLVPVINDPLSTRGLYQILKRIEDYAQIRQWKVKCIGVLMTKYRPLKDKTVIEERSRLEQQVKARCRSIGVDPPHVFKAYMPESIGVARAMDIDSPGRSKGIRKVTFGQKYSLRVGKPQQSLAVWIQDITKELVKEIQKRHEQNARDRENSREADPIDGSGL
jgi:cellulose biosynthesis protein BcsQ